MIESSRAVRRCLQLFGACLVVAASVSGAPPALAQQPDAVTIDARRCIGLESPAERLACFEAEVDDALGGEQDAAAAPATPPPAPAAAPAPAQSANEPAPAKVVEARGAPAAAPSQSEWAGTITALQERTPNRYLITLDTGEVWEQRVGERYAMRVGQRVRLADSRFGGGHRLQVEGRNGFIIVDRVQ